VRDPLKFNGFGYLFNFLVEYEDQVGEQLMYRALDIALKATPTRWWETHKVATNTWDDACCWMEVRFGPDPEDIKTKYEGQ